MCATRDVEVNKVTKHISNVMMSYNYKHSENIIKVNNPRTHIKAIFKVCHIAESSSWP